MANAGGSGGKGGAIRAGKAFVELSAEDAGLRKGLEKARQMVLGLGKKIAGVGAGVAGFGGAMIAPIVAGFKSAVDEITTVRKAAEQLGAGTEEVSALGYAAKKVGIDFDELVTSSRHLQKVIAAAADGDKGAADALAELGINAKEIVGLPLEQQFAAIADGIAALPDAAHQGAAALELMGRGGQNLLPILRQGAAGLAKMHREAEDMGAIVTPEEAEQAKLFTKAIGQARTAVEYFWHAVGKSILPLAAQLKEYSDIFVTVVQAARRWVEENGSVVAGFFLAGSAVVAVGTALVAVGSAFAIAAFAATGFAAAVGFAGTVLAALVSTPVLIAAALVTVAAVVAGLVADFGDLEDIGNTLGAVWRGVSETFMQTFGGIKNALKSGDLKLAGEIAFKGLEVAWRAVVLVMTNVWNDFKGVIVDGWYAMITELKVAMTRLLPAFSGHPLLNEQLKGVAGLGTEADIRADAARADADRKAARAADALAAAFELVKSKVELKELVDKARLAPIEHGPMPRELVRQAALTGLLGASRGGFSGFLAGQEFGAGPAVMEKIEKNTAGANEKLGRIEGKIGGLPVD